MSAVLRALLDVSAALERAGVPPLSPYWRAEAERFYTSPTATLLVECVGRGGDKSRSSVMMAVAEVLAGEFHIPRGERHYFTHVAENREEAAKTLGILEQYLRILRVKFTRSGDTIELAQLPRGFKVLACRIGAVSGWRCIGWTADECAKWSSDGADPSAEVIASIRAMTVTHVARGRMISSPLGVSGFFYDSWAVGDTDHQVVGQAPTWIANPSVSEARTHALEPDLRKHSREYGAVAQHGALSAFDPAQIDRAMRTTVPPDWTDCGRVVPVDPSAGSSDAFAWAVAGWRTQPGGGQSILEITRVDGVSDAAKKGITSTSVVSRIAQTAAESGADTVHGDQFERYALSSAFAARGLSYVAHTWTAPLKERCVEHVRGWLRDGMIALPNHDRLRHELMAFEERISPSGALTFRGRQGGHDDFAMLVLLTALVDIESGLTGSPSAPRAAGLGLLEYYQQQAAEAQGGPTSLAIADAPELVVMRAIERRPGDPSSRISGTVYARSGAQYVVNDDIVHARPSDVECLVRLGFVINAS